MRVDRCVCDGWTFAEAEAVASAATPRPDCLQGLRKELRIGTGCGLCHPYLRRMLATGRTVFHEVISEVISEVNSDGGAASASPCSCCPTEHAPPPARVELRPFEI